MTVDRNKAQKAQKLMYEFAKKYNGKSVLFAGLDEDERYRYVLLKSFNYFRFLPLPQRYDRAIKNAECQKNDGYKVFLEEPNEHLIITD